jgi:hypothetical protein
MGTIFKRFEYYLKATGVTKDEQKQALLLHVAGEEVQDIIGTLDNTGTKYDQAVAALSDYFKPRKHIPGIVRKTCISSRKAKRASQ